MVIKLNWKTIATHQYLLLFSVVLILAISSRLWQIGAVPVSLYWDEIAMMADARSIVATGRDMNNNYWLQSIYPSYGDFKLAPYIILSAPFTLLPVPPEMQIRLLSVIVGISTMAVGATLGYLLFTSLSMESRKRLALAIFTTIGLSPWSIGFSRTAFEGHLAQLFFGISILLLFASNRRWLFFVLSGFFGALAVSTYYSALYVWPLVIAAAIIIEYIRTQKISGSEKAVIRKYIGRTLLLILTFIVFLIPLLTSPFFSDMQKLRLSSQSVLDPMPFVEQSRSDRSINNHSLTNKVLYSAKIYQLKQAIRQFSTTISPNFLFIQGDPNLRHSSGYGGLYSIACFPVLLIGMYLAIRRQKLESLLLILWWLIALIPASIPMELPHALRSLNALIPLSILIGLGWVVLFESKKTWVRILAWILGLIFIIQTGAYLYHYFKVYPELSAPQWQDGYKQLAVEISNIKSDVDAVWVGHPDGRFFLWYITYGNVPPNIVQTAEKKWYEPVQLENVHFETYPTSSLRTLSVRTSIIAEKNILESMLSTEQRVPEFSQIIPTSFGESDIGLIIIGSSDLDSQLEK